MADNINTRPIYTKTTLWKYTEVDGRWQGICLECKGEKAKYTPQILKAKGIKPCSLCTDLERYEKASNHIEKEVIHD